MFPVSLSICRADEMHHFSSVEKSVASSPRYVLDATCQRPSLSRIRGSFSLNFNVSEGKFISEEDFLIRHRLTNRIATASKQCADVVHLNKKSEKAAIDKTAAETTSSFVKEGLHFIQYLIEQVLDQAGLSSEVIKGLAAFDPFVLFKRPTEVGLRHFEVLHSTIQLRSWVSSENENICRDEYLACWITCESIILQILISRKIPVTS